MADVGLLLRESAAQPFAEESLAPPSKRATRLWPVLAGALALVLVALAATGRLGPREGRAGGARTHVVAMSPLTDLPGLQNSPSLSPDGRQLLYVAEDGGDLDIFLLRVGGENAINLTADYPDDDFQPAFSPERDRIAFCSRRQGAGIFVMGATGETPRRVSDKGFDPAWSPDGAKLVYTTERVSDPYSRVGHAYLFVVDLQTGEQRKLSDIDAAGADWSPSGGRIAFWTHYESVRGQRDIWTIGADGSNPRSITDDAHTDWDPFWSPEGEWLYFFSDRGGSPDLWRVAVDETSGEALGSPEPITAGIERLTQASMASDGRRIAVTTERKTGELFTIPFDPVSETIKGDALRIFSSANAFSQIDVSRDGQWLAYQTTAPTENLYVMRIDGSGRRKILPDNGNRNRGAAWSPDGRWLLFYSNRSGTYESWAIRTDGTGLRPLTDSAIHDTLTPRWSNDGRRITMTFEEGNELELATVELTQEDLDGLEAPLEPIPLAGTRGLSGAILSPHDRLIASTMFDPLGEVGVAIFSFETGSKRFLQHADGGYVRTSRTRWLDANRLLFWEDELDSAMLWDSERNEIRPLERIPGPSEIAATPDGRTLVVNRTRHESDIWLLTLAD